MSQLAAAPQEQPSDVGVFSYTLLWQTACIVLLGFNIAFFVQNRELKSEAGKPSRGLFPTPGLKASSLSGTDRNGLRESLQFGTEKNKTLLLVFSTKCPVCELNWPAWQAITEVGDEPRPYRLAYANINSLFSDDYLLGHHFTDSALFASTDPRTIRELNLGITPLTIILTPQGEVERVWAGLLREDDKNEITKALGK